MQVHVTVSRHCPLKNHDDLSNHTLHFQCSRLLQMSQEHPDPVPALSRISFQDLGLLTLKSVQMHSELLALLLSFLSRGAPE